MQLFKIEDELNDILDSVRKRQEPELAQHSVELFQELQTMKTRFIIDNKQYEFEKMLDAIKLKVETENSNRYEEKRRISTYFYSINSQARFLKTMELFNLPVDDIYRNFYITAQSENKHLGQDVRQFNELQKMVFEIVNINYEKAVYRAAHKVVRSHSVEFEEARSIGSIGLMKAVIGFDSQRSEDFTKYALSMISNELRDEMKLRVKSKEAEFRYVEVIKTMIERFDDVSDMVHRTNCIERK